MDQRRIEWRNRAQFFGVAAQAMRRILVDHARGQHAAKRGGGMQQITLNDANQPWPPEWWGMWWPRALRRPSDLWRRLPCRLAP